jgi:hypothetical protein
MASVLTLSNPLVPTLRVVVLCNVAAVGTYLRRQVFIDLDKQLASTANLSLKGRRRTCKDSRSSWGTGRELSVADHDYQLLAHLVFVRPGEAVNDLLPGLLSLDILLELELTNYFGSLDSINGSQGAV